MKGACHAAPSTDASEPFDNNDGNDTASNSIYLHMMTDVRYLLFVPETGMYDVVKRAYVT